MSESLRTELLLPRRAAWPRILLALAVMLLLGALAGWLSWQNSVAIQREALSHRLALYASALDAELKRFEALPSVLAIDPKVQRLLAGAANPLLIEDLNRYLETINAEAGSAMLYVMNREGDTLASSNWASSTSFVGSNYRFRPYFRDALAGGTGRFYAVGATTQLPGVFIARPVRLGGQVAGVLAVKVHLDSIESAWSQGGERMLVSDQQGVVTLASFPAWKFATLQPLDAAVRARLAQTRQYYTSPLPPLPFVWQGDDRVSIADHDYLVLSRPLERLGWQMHLLGDLAEARSRAVLSATTTVLALLALTLGSLYARLRLKRLRERLAAQLILERTVAERTAELANANLRLQDEIEDKRQAEQALRETQAELIRSSKLAALGRMATGVAHELNQPLAALRSFADNTRQYLQLGRHAEADANLARIMAQTDKLGAMTAELKLFASRRPVAGHCDLAELQAGLHEQLLPRLDACRASLIWQLPSSCPLPLAPLAVEQIIINLVGNAAEALGDAALREIRIAAGEEGDAVWLQVSDSGPGLPADNPGRVFEPFYSTKQWGQGLGLGLAIVAGIVEDGGGHIVAANLATGGACFRLRLPLPEKN